MYNYYTIRSTKWGHAIIGSIPVDELVALSKTWEAHGFNLIAANVAHALGASIAVVRTEDDAKAWLQELGCGHGQEDWLKSGDTGISSETIFSVFTGRPISMRFGPGVPHDPSDFGRCHRLLERFPEWRARLQEVADRYPIWQPFVNAWPALTKLWDEESPSGRCPRLYAMMQELQN